MSIMATLYTPPNGARSQIEIVDIRLTDETWFLEHNAKISCEEINGNYVVYADVGLGEEHEAIEISRGRSCADTMSALRAQCESLLEHVKP